MELKVQEVNGVQIAEVALNSTEINNVDDALDLIGNAGYLGATAVLLYENVLHPDFFDLKTKLAGEILQKFSNYHMLLGIVGEFEKYNSKSLKDFIYESNTKGKVIFGADAGQVKALLAQKAV